MLRSREDKYVETQYPVGREDSRYKGPVSRREELTESPDLSECARRSSVTAEARLSARVHPHTHPHRLVMVSTVLVIQANSRATSIHAANSIGTRPSGVASGELQPPHDNSLCPKGLSIAPQVAGVGATPRIDAVLARVTLDVVLAPLFGRRRLAGLLAQVALKPVRVEVHAALERLGC